MIIYQYNSNNTTGFAFSNFSTSALKNSH